MVLLALWLLAGVAAAEVRVTDFAGREVVLAKPAERIIALAPHVVENAFSAGAGERLVGVVEYSDYPAAAQRIPRVGNFASWSLEALVDLEPDLVLAWGSGNGMQRIEALARFGIPVYVSELRRLTDVSRDIRNIARLAGTNGETRAANYDARLAALTGDHAQRRPVSVFYQVWHQPLQTVNGQHLISDVIRRCGGHNIYAEEAQIAPTINIESLLTRDPEVIIASGMDGKRPAWLDSWQRYPSLRAVQNGAIYFIDPNLLQRPTSRVLNGAALLCAQLDAAR